MPGNYGRADVEQSARKARLALDKASHVAEVVLVRQFLLAPDPSVDERLQIPVYVHVFRVNAWLKGSGKQVIPVLYEMGPCPALDAYVAGAPRYPGDKGIVALKEQAFRGERRLWGTAAYTNDWYQDLGLDDYLDSHRGAD